MILSIIVFIAIILIGIFIERDFWADCIGYSLFVSLSTLVISCLIYSALQPTQIIVTEANIYTLETDVSSEGSFSLGSGSIDGISYYYYYTQDENDLYELNKVKTDNCKLRLTDNESPKIITKKEVVKENINWFFCTGKSWDYCCDYKYELVVPTNTIHINSFNGMVG